MWLKERVGDNTIGLTQFDVIPAKAGIQIMQNRPRFQQSQGMTEGKTTKTSPTA